MVDYSRFDHIGSDSDSGDDGAAAPAKKTGHSRPVPASTASRPPDAAALSTQPDKSRKTATLSQPASNPASGRSSRGSGALEGSASLHQPTMITASRKGKEGRIKFEHEGTTVYEWEQSMEEVNLYIETPPGVKADRVDCKITPTHIRLGLKGNPPFIDEDTGGPVVVEESYWMMDGGELNVNLQKMKKADTWPAALQGRNTTVDPVTLEGMQKKIMLERFQSENPGFDFSGAEFNGQVPDARSFMGGVKYT
ncbi:unnamed protein product [Hapterophycus canaliculatus]